MQPTGQRGRAVLILCPVKLLEHGKGGGSERTLACFSPSPSVKVSFCRYPAGGREDRKEIFGGFKLL